MFAKYASRPLMSLATLLLLTNGIAHAQEVIKVGFAAPLTGVAAGYGKDVQNGVQLAVDNANASNPKINGNPVKYQMVSVDDQGDPRIAVTVAQSLVDDKVNFVIGHFTSGCALPTAPIYSKAGIPSILPAASNPAITEAGLQDVYRVITTDKQNAGDAGRWAVKVAKAKKIAIIDNRSAFGQGEADEFEAAVKAAGGNIVKREYTSEKAVDFSAQLTSFKSADADLIFFAGLDAQGGLFIKRMKQLGLKAQFVAGGGVADSDFIKIAGGSAEGAMAWEYGQPLDTLPAGKSFAAQYKQRFGQDMLAYAPFAYDAAWAAIKASQAANSSDPAKINAAIKKVDFQGVTGRIAFASNGDLREPRSTLYKVVKGAWTPVSSSAPQ